MIRKTVFAIAVAGACAWPVVTLADHHSGYEVRTPMSDSEVGPNQMPTRYTAVPRYNSDEGRYEVQTPLSVSEVGPLVNWNSYWGWYDPAPDSVRLSHGLVVDRYGRPVVGATRGEPETYYVVPRR